MPFRTVNAQDGPWEDSAWRRLTWMSLADDDGENSQNHVSWEVSARKTRERQRPAWAPRRAYACLSLVLFRGDIDTGRPWVPWEPLWSPLLTFVQSVPWLARYMCADSVTNVSPRHQNRHFGGEKICQLRRGGLMNPSAPQRALGPSAWPPPCQRACPRARAHGCPVPTCPLQPDHWIS